MRMQNKLTLALSFIALFSGMLVGATAYYIVRQDIAESSTEQAFQTFQRDFVAYAKTYGSVKTALETESFDAFILRLHTHPEPIQKLDNPPLTNRWQSSPFRFLVTDAEGVVLLPANGFTVGEVAPRKMGDQAMDIVMDGKVIARASRLGTASFTESDARHLDAVLQSLVTGVIVAVGVAILFGLLLGRLLSSSMRNLVSAIRQIPAQQEEVYQVEVASDDEVGQLAESFNQMNVELSKAHTELRELAIRDPLTNLYNRRHFDEQARQFYESATRYNHPLSVMIGDLDSFEQIKEEFSYEIGDLVLEKVAEIIRACTRKSDVVARYYGEEMVVLFANTSRKNAAISCENIKKAIASYPWDGFAPNLSVTMSIGLCDNTGLASVDAMLSLAGRHLSAAKTDGRNKLVFE